MERKVRLGMTPTGVVSIVFASLGALYFILGICLRSFSVDAEDATVGTVFSVLGGVFLLAALLLFLCVLANRKRIQNILNSGKYIWGEIVDIVPNYNVRINNRNPYVILVRYADRNGNIHIFRSADQKAYPDRSVIGRQVKVYYENEGFKHYYVELQNILPNVIEH